jgi:hypothetical protein
MRNSIFLFFVLLVCRHVDAQLVEIIIPGSVNNFDSKAKIFGATLYLVQDGITISKSITTNTGAYTISGKLNTSIPFELIVSKPNHITKKVYFNFKNITTKGQDISVQAVEELIIELFAVKQGITITISPTDYAEKFTWDNDQKIAIPDEEHKKLSQEKIINLYKEAELSAQLSILDSKANASAQAKNYENGNLSANIQNSKGQCYDVEKRQKKKQKKYKLISKHLSTSFKVGSCMRRNLSLLLRGYWQAGFWPGAHIPLYPTSDDQEHHTKNENDVGLS